MGRCARRISQDHLQPVYAVPALGHAYPPSADAGASRASDRRHGPVPYLRAERQRRPEMQHRESSSSRAAPSRSGRAWISAAVQPGNAPLVADAWNAPATRRWIVRPGRSARKRPASAAPCSGTSTQTSGKPHACVQPQLGPPHVRRVIDLEYHVREVVLPRASSPWGPRRRARRGCTYTDSSACRMRRGAPCSSRCIRSASTRSTRWPTRARRQSGPSAPSGGATASRDTGWSARRPSDLRVGVPEFQAALPGVDLAPRHAPGRRNRGTGPPAAPTQAPGPPARGRSERAAGARNQPSSRFYRRTVEAETCGVDVPQRDGTTLTLSDGGFYVYIAWCIHRSRTTDMVRTQICVTDQRAEVASQGWRSDRARPFPKLRTVPSSRRAVGGARRPSGKSAGIWRDRTDLPDVDALRRGWDRD